MSYYPLDTITDFLEPLNVAALSGDEPYNEKQIGTHIKIYENNFPDLENVDAVIIGCNETRGAGKNTAALISADVARSEFYKLYHWHSDVMLADAGNVSIGATLQDTYAALRTVILELLEHNKKVIILGGSHDLALAQYQAYAAQKKIIEAASIDAFINLDMQSPLPADNFLMKMFTGDPNFTRHYNHIGFQSYFVNPHMLETIDKLRFDCFRTGYVKEHLSEMEPVLRNTDLLSFDISAIQHSHAPSNTATPNGFNGEEACTLMQYAGMSHQVSTLGMYGYYASDDLHHLTAKQLSHMLWYLMDGIQKGKQEAPLSEADAFNEFILAFAEVESQFLQSKKTGRWWMQLPNGKYIACSHKDYITASQNEIPERWLRAVERN